MNGGYRKTERMNYRCRRNYDEELDAGKAPAVEFSNWKPARRMPYSETEMYST
jgi:hypothetical protein